MLGTYFYRDYKKDYYFGTLFNNISLDTPKVMVVFWMKLKSVFYGPMQKFLQRFKSRSNYQINCITLPRMSFEMTGIQYDSTRKMGITQTFKANDSDGKPKGIHASPYNIQFELNIFSVK